MKDHDQVQPLLENNEVYEIDAKEDEKANAHKEMTSSEKLTQSPIVEYGYTFFPDKLKRHFTSIYYLKELATIPSHHSYFKLFFCSTGVFVFYLLYSILQEEIV